MRLDERLKIFNDIRLMARKIYPNVQGDLSRYGDYTPGELYSIKKLLEAIKSTINELE